MNAPTRDFAIRVPDKAHHFGADQTDPLANATHRHAATSSHLQSTLFG
jgi:hypothetical protein